MMYYDSWGLSRIRFLLFRPDELLSRFLYPLLDLSDYDSEKRLDLTDSRSDWLFEPLKFYRC